MHRLRQKGAREYASRGSEGADGEVLDGESVARAQSLGLAGRRPVGAAGHEDDGNHSVVVGHPPHRLRGTSHENLPPSARGLARVDPRGLRSPVARLRFAELSRKR